MVSENKIKSTIDDDQCRRCQHNVVVRGVEQVVCLAFLAVRHPMKDSFCDEFEDKRIRAAATCDTPPPAQPEAQP